MRHKIWHWYAYFNIAVVACGVGLFGWWYFLQDAVEGPPIVYKSDLQAFGTDKAVYRRGEDIQVSFSFCKIRPVPAEVDWKLVDGIRIGFSQQTSSSPVGCYGDANGGKPYYRLVGKIPEFVDAGEYHLEGTVTFQVNPVKQDVYQVRTRDFYVQ